MSTIHVGNGSHMVEFYHREVGTLRTYTGVDSVAWGYTLNTADWYTYGGQVVQILSCYVEDVTVTGALQTYTDMEDLYSYFLHYMQAASQGDKRNPIPGKESYNQEPMKMRYPHRGWEFDVIVTSAPGFKIGRDVVVPAWRIVAHIADESQDVHELSELIISEAELKSAMGDDANFGLQGKIRFTDENPFSDPFTEKGMDFSNKDLSDRVDELAQWYNELLPSYLSGDFDAILGSVGSKPAFGTRSGPQDNDKTPDKIVKK